MIWRGQLRRLKALVRAAKPLQSDWYARTPSAIRPATGVVQTVALAHLMDRWGLGGQRWLKQFVSGFDIVGAFSQAHLFPTFPNFRPPSKRIRFEIGRLSVFARAPVLLVSSTLIVYGRMLSGRLRVDGSARHHLWARTDYRPVSPMARLTMPFAPLSYRRERSAIAMI